MASPVSASARPSEVGLHLFAAALIDNFAPRCIAEVSQTVATGGQVDAHTVHPFAENHLYRVEALAEGPPQAVEEFKHDLAAGPANSHVNHFEEIVVEPSGRYPAFRIER